MANNSQKTSWKETGISLAVIIPSIITILNTQALFELNFKLLNKEELLLIIPRDGSAVDIMLGVFLFYGSIVVLITTKKIKNKKISILTLLAGMIFIFLSLQTYTAITPNNIISTKVLKFSHVYHPYSNIDKFEIGVNIRPSSSRRGYSNRCYPHFEFIGLKNPFTPIFETDIPPVDKQQAYRLIEIIKEKNIPIQHIVFNNCANNPSQFREVEAEFLRQLGK